MVKKERCVLFGCETKVSKSMPIELRSEYVEGVGQLCPNCFRDTFRDQGNKSTAPRTEAGKRDKARNKKGIKKPVWKEG